MVTFQIVCGHCGNSAECAVEERAGTVLCRICQQRIPLGAAAPIPDRIELESGADTSRVARNECFVGGLQPGRAASASLTTPAAAPIQPKDADKALCNVALGILRFNNWPCEEEPGYRSFNMTVRFRNAAGGLIATDNFRVFAQQGVLFFEQIILQLPALPHTPVLEMLNHINQCSIGSVFTQQKAGVMMRHAVIPRTREEGYFTTRMMMQSVRQMFHDRRHALSLLRQVVETGMIDPLCIARAYSQPVAPCPLPSFNLDQASDLAGFAGYYVFKGDKLVYLSRDAMTPQKCPVRLTPMPGYLRGQVVLGEVWNGRHTWTFIPPRVRDLLRGHKVPSQRSGELYERLNALNQLPSLLRFVHAQHSIAAMAVIFPTDAVPTVEQFKVFADTLLDHAADGGREKPKSGRRLAS